MLKIRGNNLLKGTINVKGSKNASLGLMVASILIRGRVKLLNVPNILDVKVLLNIFKYLNVSVNFNNNILEINSENIEYKSLIIDDVKKIRASSYLMGAFLSLFNKVEICNPGGCAFSNRPIDFHLKAFREFGVDVKEENDKLELNSKEIHNGYFYIPSVSVGTTIDLLLFASLHNNMFILDNVAIECEVEEVIKFLKLAGVEILKVKEKTLLIKGKEILNKDLEYVVMNDRIEAGTLALLGASLGDNLVIKGFNIFDNLYLLNLFNKLKVPYVLKEKTLTISRFRDFDGLDLETNPYPFLPTDLQPLISVFLSLGKSKSTIKENIYPSRLSHVDQLNKLNFNLDVKNNKIIINPMNKLKGNIVIGKDLRGGCALLIASLLVDDYTYFEGVNYIERGYENFINRLKEIGALIYEEKDNYIK